MSRTPGCSTTKPYSAQSSFLSPTLPATSNSRAPSRTGSVRSAAPPALPPPIYTIEKTPHARAHARRRRYCALGCVALVLVVLAVVLPVVFTVGRRRSSSSSSGAAPGGDSCDGCEQVGGGVLIGRDGATVKTRDGSTFVYRNAFGGYFVQDSKNAYNDGARAQSFTPALNESWTWGTDKIRGVNLGGWLVPEPFIAPALYQKYLATGTLTGDEWTLSLAMQAAGDKELNELKEHYRTFITEEDFAQIAGAGLNWIRLPIPFWSLETSASANDWPGEPFLKGASWDYVLLAFAWARKYGLRVNLDLHTLPGAQNPWVHAGRAGEVNFLQGPMGYANAQRGLDYIRALTLFISQPEYKNVVPMFGIVNEPTADVGALRELANKDLRGGPGDAQEEREVLPAVAHQKARPPAHAVIYLRHSSPSPAGVAAFLPSELAGRAQHAGNDADSAWPDIHSLLVFGRTGRSEFSRRVGQSLAIVLLRDSFQRSNQRGTATFRLLRDVPSSGGTSNGSIVSAPRMAR